MSYSLSSDIITSDPNEYRSTVDFFSYRSISIYTQGSFNFIFGCIANIASDDAVVIARLRFQGIVLK
jgi:hypothetical protein